MNDEDLSVETITKEICKIAEENPSLNYYEAAVEYSEINDIELEIISEIIRRSVILKEKIRKDAEKMKMVKPKTKRLQ